MKTIKLLSVIDTESIATKIADILELSLIGDDEISLSDEEQIKLNNLVFCIAEAELDSIELSICHE